ncbi:hypothetical protein GCM10011360_04660 [Primorskyibacter flagellatus]|uniref:Uncharacterized protein n=1 Tax=Primorskyibacter flagellatus TaxID=1387277 RepID=A0A916ZYJ6_9RHOB|nr:hypothetical protein GCM10011360_04660 [Primorskyibacter flagellatus]
MQGQRHGQPADAAAGNQHGIVSHIKVLPQTNPVSLIIRPAEINARGVKGYPTEKVGIDIGD